MRGKFKPLAGQVIVVTGAALGPGPGGRRLAAKAGAAVVLAGARRAGGAQRPARRSPRPADGAIRWPATLRPPRGATVWRGPPRPASDASTAGSRPAASEAALAHAAKALVRPHRRPRRAGRPGRLRPADRQGRARPSCGAAKGKVAATLIRLPDGLAPRQPGRGRGRGGAARGDQADGPDGGGRQGQGPDRRHPGPQASRPRGRRGPAGRWPARRCGSAAAGSRRRPPPPGRGWRAPCGPPVIGMVKRRPLQAARLAARHPRPALKLARVAALIFTTP